MKTRSDAFQFEKELDWEKPAPGIRRQIMGYDGQLMMVKVEFEKGAVGSMHQHYHSQATYVASGKFELTIGDRKEILSTGDGYYVEPDQPHGCVCLEAGVLIDTCHILKQEKFKTDIYGKDSKKIDGFGG